MDTEVHRVLAKAGLSLDGAMPCIGVCVDEHRRPQALGAAVRVMGGRNDVDITLKPISSLWTGTAKPPDFAQGPPPAYELFFLLIERTARDYCAATGQPVYDAEFERLYNHLRRRPDGRDANPLFSYLQAAAALYLSLRDVSQDEYEAVLRRLTQSARRFNAGAGSTNYVDRALALVP